MQGEPATPFFLPSGVGQRYCLYQRGRFDAPAVLFVHPFGEELNRSRRMVALQARALAARGIASLRIDLHGCGDSSGDFSDARWEQWREDLAGAAGWLRTQGHTSVALLGLRLGCLLALDSAPQLPLPVQRMVLWQLPASGKQYLTQWLRLRSVNAMMGDSAAQEGPQALLKRLQEGETIEVGGYGLAPAMAAALESLAPPAPTVRATCFDLVQAPASQALPATLRATTAWPHVRVHAIEGPPFWSTPEIETCQHLINATCLALDSE